MSDWSRFFAWRLPLALLGVALLIEAGAAALHGVTLHRHNVDDLANAVEHDTHPYRVVLLGDSVTHNVANKYRIGAPEQVADLTTHAFAGLPSAWFLLKRYVDAGHHPQHVVLAISRRVLTAPISHATFTYYVTSTFTQPYERAFLQAHYPTYVDYRWRPAALSMTTRIGEPLFSLLRHPGDQIWHAPEPAPARPTIPVIPDYYEDPATVRTYLDEPLVMLPEARAILSAMAELSVRNHFQLHLIWAPLAPDIRTPLAARGTLAALDTEVQSTMRAAGATITVDDCSAHRDYPYFDRDLVHLRGAPSEEAYADQLTTFIAALDRP